MQHEQTDLTAATKLDLNLRAAIYIILKYAFLIMIDDGNYEQCGKGENSFNKFFFLLTSNTMLIKCDRVVKL